MYGLYTAVYPQYYKRTLQSFGYLARCNRIRWSNKPRRTQLVGSHSQKPHLSASRPEAATTQFPEANMAPVYLPRRYTTKGAL
jgi:hypothetical protein